MVSTSALHGQSWTALLSTEGANPKPNGSATSAWMSFRPMPALENKFHCDHIARIVAQLVLGRTWQGTWILATCNVPFFLIATLWQTLRAGTCTLRPRLLNLLPVCVSFTFASPGATSRFTHMFASSITTDKMTRSVPPTNRGSAC